jgi:hypothetical protein
MFFCYECCVLSVRGLCDGLITRPGEPYRPWCVVVCDRETSWMRRRWPTGGCRAKIKQTCSIIIIVVVAAFVVIICLKRHVCLTYIVFTSKINQLPACTASKKRLSSQKCIPLYPVFSKFNQSHILTSILTSFSQVQSPESCLLWLCPPRIVQSFLISFRMNTSRPSRVPI